MGQTIIHLLGIQWKAHFEQVESNTDLELVNGSHLPIDRVASWPLDF